MWRFPHIASFYFDKNFFKIFGKKVILKQKFPNCNNKLNTRRTFMQ